MPADLPRMAAADAGASLKREPLDPIEQALVRALVASIVRELRAVEDLAKPIMLYRRLG